MKIRKGFVSNSSSSSFVVCEPTVVEAAFGMVPARGWNDEDRDVELMKKLQKLHDDQE